MSVVLIWLILQFICKTLNEDVRVCLLPLALVLAAEHFYDNITCVLCMSVEKSSRDNQSLNPQRKQVSRIQDISEMKILQ